MAFGNQIAIGTCSWIIGGNDAGFAREAGVFSKIPWLPIVHIGTGFIENDSRIGPDAAGEAFIETRGKHGPFAAVRMTDNANTFRIDLRQIRQSEATIGGDVSEE